MQSWHEKTYHENNKNVCCIKKILHLACNFNLFVLEIKVFIE